MLICLMIIFWRRILENFPRTATLIKMILKRLIYRLIIILFIVIFIFLPAIKFHLCEKSDDIIGKENQNSTRMSGIIFEKKIKYLLRSFPPPFKNTTRYLLMQIPQHWNGDCGGLANQMWRFAVIYSLAKSIGRFPGISYASTWTCDKLNSPREIERTFPLFHAVQYYFQVESNDEFIYDRTFEDHCCKYYDARILEKYTAKYLIISPPPQSPKYLLNINNEIRELFRFSDNIRMNVDNFIYRLFRFVLIHLASFCLF
uniref:Uncharacterized protein n=1 Tax=Meloidogyne enterolobii TaxID=390850 RepID=A0A6V7VJS2_MELEN|nr:unnamed protein product [Meloidogyne enterolobii]